LYYLTQDLIQDGLDTAPLFGELVRRKHPRQPEDTRGNTLE
jgi:hypothetical protein